MIRSSFALVAASAALIACGTSVNDDDDGGGGAGGQGSGGNDGSGAGSGDPDPVVETATEVCDAMCECVSCANGAFETCMEDLSEEQRPPGEECETPYVAYLECMVGVYRCDDYDVCDAAYDAYATCMGFPDDPGTPCDELTDLAEAGGCAGGGEEECTGEAEEAAICYLANVADVCNPTSEELTAYTDCVGD